MSTKEILIELKAHIKDLTLEKDRLNEDIKAKDSRIRMLLTKIEQADDEVRSMGKKLSENNRRMEEMDEELAAVKKTLEELQPKSDEEPVNETEEK